MKDAAVRTHPCPASVARGHQSCSPAHCSRHRDHTPNPPPPTPRCPPAPSWGFPAACMPVVILCKMNNASLYFCEDGCHSFTCQSLNEYSVRIVASAPAMSRQGQQVTHGKLILECSSCMGFTTGQHLKPAGGEIAIQGAPVLEFSAGASHGLAQGRAVCL